MTGLEQPCFVFCLNDSSVEALELLGPESTEWSLGRLRLCRAPYIPLLLVLDTCQVKWEFVAGFDGSPVVSWPCGICIARFEHSWPGRDALAFGLRPIPPGHPSSEVTQFSIEPE